MQVGREKFKAHVKAYFKDPKDIAALSSGLINLACAQGNEDAADSALDGLVDSLEDLMGAALSPCDVAVPRMGCAEESWKDDPAIVEAIGPLPVQRPGLARPNLAYPSVTVMALPQGLLDHLETFMHTQPNHAAAHVGDAKRRGPTDTKGLKRNRLLDGVTASIMARPGTHEQVSEGVDARASAAEVEAIGPRIIRMFLCSHR